MTIATLGKFRLHTVTALTAIKPEPKFDTMPIAERGLAIEKECDNEGHYYVIAFIRPDSDERSHDMETVGDRFFHDVVTMQDYSDVKFLYEMACHVIDRALDVHEDEE